MHQKAVYRPVIMTERKYLTVLKNAFGLGITSRINVMGQLGIKSMKLKDKLTMARVLEAVRSLEQVGPLFKAQKIQERKELNQLNILRAVRFLNGLPCHGQRTQTNAGTSRRRAGKKRGNEYAMPKRRAWRIRLLARRGESASTTTRRKKRQRFFIKVKSGLLHKIISERLFVAREKALCFRLLGKKKSKYLAEKKVVLRLSRAILLHVKNYKKLKEINKKISKKRLIGFLKRFSRRVQFKSLALIRKGVRKVKKIHRKKMPPAKIKMIWEKILKVIKMHVPKRRLRRIKRMTKGIICKIIGYVIQNKFKKNPKKRQNKDMLKITQNKNVFKNIQEDGPTRTSKKVAIIKKQFENINVKSDKVKS